MTKSNTATLMQSLVEGLEKNDAEKCGAAAIGLVSNFMENQERQTAAMERVAAALEAQSEMLKASFKGNAAG